MISLLKLFFIFIILLLSSKFVGLVGGIFVAITLVGIFTQISSSVLTHTVLYSLINVDTLSLAIVVLLILVFSNLLKSTNQLNIIVNQFKQLQLSPKILSIIMPSLIGLLPMPGGALFSAPMIESSLMEKNVPGHLKVSINYWFRHVLEFSWPMYPGFLLAISIFQIPMWKAVMFNIPLTLGGILIGWIFLLSQITPTENKVATTYSIKVIKTLCLEILPIILVIVLMFSIDLIVYLISFAGIKLNTSSYHSMIIGLIVAIGVLTKQKSIPLRDIFNAFLSKNIIPMVLSVIGIMIFKDVLIQSHLIESIQKELHTSNVSSLTIILLLPLISGIVTGVSVGFVGTSFPLILSLILPKVQGFNEIIFYYVLCFGLGFLGVMLSPVHICLILTKQYFNVSFYKIYKLLFILVFSMLCWIITIAFLYKVLLKF